ncbi:MAG: aldo/keto reductase, partial [Geminicoccaceae bacterium]
YVGCSNYTGWQLMKALGTSERQGLERFASQQIHYTLEAREAEYELVPIAVDQGVGILVWSPLAGGLLTGKYRRGQPHPPGSRHLTDWGEPPVRDEGRLYDIVDALVAIASERGVPPTQVALAWLLGRPGVCSLVVGARTEQQLIDNLGAVELELSGAERERLDHVSAPPLIYPYWHQAKTASDRLSAADRTLLGPHL